MLKERKQENKEMGEGKETRVEGAGGKEQVRNGKKIIIIKEMTRGKGTREERKKINERKGERKNEQQERWRAERNRGRGRRENKQERRKMETK